MKRMISTFIIITITLMLLPPASADLNDGLVAFWPFYGNAHDESGNGNDGVVYGATLCADRFGAANSAYCFDGVDDYINIGNNVKPPFPITVSAWVKPYDLHYNGCIFRNDRWNDQSYRYGLATMFNGQGESRSHVFEGFSACWNRRSKTSNDFVASTGNWHHFVVVFQAHDDMRHFWNGVALDGHSECFGSGMTYSSADGAIGHNISPTGDRYVKAAIDDIRVYDRALSEDEINDLFTKLPDPCTLSVGHNDYCRDCGPCNEGDGDCDNDSECETGLTCVQVTGTDTCQSVPDPCTLPVGHLDYCQGACGPCTEGEGDCDNDSECETGLTCVQVTGTDTCQSVPDPCTLPVGDLDYCLECGPCAAGQGDCDNDSECQSGLTCVQIIGTDTCQSVPDPCALPVGDLDYCLECGPCAAGEGDCDNDSECQSGLSCVQVTGSDVCCPHPLGHLDYCRDCGPCATGQGDCDTDGECQSGLTCVQVTGTDTCQ